MLTNKQEITFFVFLGLTLVLLLTFTYVYGHKSIRSNNTPVVNDGVPAKLKNINLSAKAAYVYDSLSGKVLYAKNENERLPLASLTKTMSALVAMEIAPEYSTVVITGEAIKADGDAGLYPGEVWLLKDLLDFSLVSSANDGIRAVALSLGALSNSGATNEARENDFIRKMNEKAALLGMKNTYYLNDTGLDLSSKQGGAYGSAKDQVLLFEYVLKNYPALLIATKEPSVVVKSLDGVTHIAKNTSEIVNQIPGIMASKTGFTDLAGGNLVVAYDPEIGRTVIISVIGSTEQGRFTDMIQLVKASLESVQNSVISKQ